MGWTYIGKDSSEEGFQVFLPFLFCVGGLHYFSRIHFFTLFTDADIAQELLQLDQKAFFFLVIIESQDLMKRS